LLCNAIDNCMFRNIRYIERTNPNYETIQAPPWISSSIARWEDSLEVFCIYHEHAWQIANING
ncbi:hypothetical protein M5X00_27290, partial [Paenibacillus alvei]